MVQLINMKLIGVTKISQGGKITLIKEVAEMLKAKEGDKIVFYLDKDNRVIIQRV